MKISINRNIVWCDVFIDQLVNLGVKYACVSPGSRSTPLIISFSGNKNITMHTIVDERSSAFFALGLAKKSNTPVVLVTTSGTAVAELYPAIIEAYYQRIPLIIITADRPPILRNSGANQTINQHNIYSNHIRFFADAGLPNIQKLSSMKKLATDAFEHACVIDRGPVHLNFPFEKPFEPKSYTDKIDVVKLEKLFSSATPTVKATNENHIALKSLAKRFSYTKKGLILIGYSYYANEFPEEVVKFSKKFGYPIYVDGSSSLRFGSHAKTNIIDNLTAIVRSGQFRKDYDPDLIIQFGGAPTSNVLLEFFKNSSAEKILVNRFGDKNDPSQTAKTVLAIDAALFCKTLDSFDITTGKSSWLESIRRMNKIAVHQKENIIRRAPFMFEGKIADELFENIPAKSDVMISNSLPIRDVDFFASANNKQINIFTNRGASGIDGINSTAVGIARASNNPTFLLTGDLAFYHDLNGIYNSIKFKVPLTVVLINNDGGGIFHSLPISDYPEIFAENFLTPMELNFAKLVQAYGGQFRKIRSWEEFRKKLGRSAGINKLTVLEIRTDAIRSKLQRQKYWNAVANKIDEFINESRRRRYRI